MSRVFVKILDDVSRHDPGLSDQEDSTFTDPVESVSSGAVLHKRKKLS